MEQLSREQRINILQRLYEVWADQNNQVIDEISITEKKEIEEEVDDEDALYRCAANDIRMILIWEKEKDEKEK